MINHFRYIISLDRCDNCLKYISPARAVRKSHVITWHVRLIASRTLTFEWRMISLRGITRLKKSKARLRFSCIFQPRAFASFCRCLVLRSRGCVFFFLFEELLLVENQIFLLRFGFEWSFRCVLNVNVYGIMKLNTQRVKGICEKFWLKCIFICEYNVVCDESI